MRDGYYLSTYLTPPGLARIVKVWLRHDTNVSLWEKSGSTVRLHRYWELERLTGRKYEGTALLEAAGARALLDPLLRPEGLTCDDLVEIWGTPGIATVDDYHLVDDIEDVAFHTVAHLYSAMLLDADAFFGGQILGMAVDGGPDPALERTIKPAWYAGGVVREGNLSVFPVESPATLWLQAQRRFGLREGTLMALASATDASVRLDRGRIADRFRFTDQMVRESAPAALERIVDEVTSIIEGPAGDRFTGFDPRFSARENFVSIVMKEVQAISIAVMERNVEAILDRFQLDPAATHLALAGGFALNCPSNSHLMTRYGFRGLLAPPCVNDSGQSLGIALAAFHKKLGGERFSFELPGPYAGMEDAGLDRQLAAHRDFVEDVSNLDLARLVDDLEAGPVVWFDGAAEIGPRALGHRSILADPRQPRSKETLNRIKGREWWRPVAPVVLEEHLPDWFEDPRPSPFMLETFTIRADRRAAIPAVAHLDHSARIQSLSRPQNPALYDLLRAFHARTGVPLLCNTSLNDNHEPIVNRIDEAMNFCLRKRVRVGCFNGRRVAFRRFDDYPPAGPKPRGLDSLAPLSPGEEAAWTASLNPHSLPEDCLRVYLWNPVLRARFDPTSAREARQLRRAVELLFARFPDSQPRLHAYVERTRQEMAELGYGPG